MATAPFAISNKLHDYWPAARQNPQSIGLGLSLTIRGLGKSFGDRQVLKSLDIHIPAGQFVAIVGKSGCGKSTLLRLLVGLEKSTSGEFWYGASPEEKHDQSAVRVMFQEPRLLPWAHILANVEVGLGRERKKSDARDRAVATLEEVGLGDRRNDWPATLSGGQKQRVALARALVSHPRVLALDEPLGALDALTRISMQRLLERIWREQGFTALLVTHDVAEALTLADRVLIIEEGIVKHDMRVDIPRPRQRGGAEIAALEGKILDVLFGDSASIEQL
jgi:sulfonate transport system ATP-binding protein